jgi:predicted RNA-binding Zn-ribbon protein involved in translation (DUF1610 family)
LRILVSEGKGGRVRIDYCTGDRNETRMWEPAGNGILETTFNADGHILRQRLLRAEPAEVRRASDAFIAELAPDSVVHAEFEEVKLNKNCPKCGKACLRRYAEERSSSEMLPVMPIYACAACGTKSYLLTDEYLDYLVTNNREMFTQDELRELDGSRDKFMAELKGYIIRIFASKKILSIC